MVRRLLKALVFATLVGVACGVEVRMGRNVEGTFWIYSCALKVGASVGSEGFKGLAWSQPRARATTKQNSISEAACL